MTIWSRSLATMAVRRPCPAARQRAVGHEVRRPDGAQRDLGEASLASVNGSGRPFRASGRAAYATARRVPRAAPAPPACSQPGSTPPGMTFGDIISRYGNSRAVSRLPGPRSAAAPTPRWTIRAGHLPRREARAPVGTSRAGPRWSTRPRPARTAAGTQAGSGRPSAMPRCPAAAGCPGRSGGPAAPAAGVLRVAGCSRLCHQSRLEERLLRYGLRRETVDQVRGAAGVSGPAAGRLGWEVSSRRLTACTDSTRRSSGRTMVRVSCIGASMDGHPRGGYGG